ncbi:MAG: TetR/AcrR family transcriptional regulator [Treponema sp.]|nr:TetR/AcrR family transcriptional regulator [Treponema sp.]
MPAGEKITKEKIIRAVLDSAFDKSVGGTSLADISEKLGIKKASLYNHYESRDAMIDDTVSYCADQLRRTNFIPADMVATAQKYPAETVFKGIVNRWFKLNEKEPLLQVYVFVESEKYFSNQAAAIITEMRNKLIDQVVSALTALSDAQKIKPVDAATAKEYAVIFASMVRDILDIYLTEKKVQIRSNPETGSDTLFSAIPASEPDFSKIDTLIEQFCGLLKR